VVKAGRFLILIQWVFAVHRQHFSKVYDQEEIPTPNINSTRKLFYRIPHSPVPKFMVFEGEYQGNPDLPFPTNKPYYHQGMRRFATGLPPTLGD
jgi:hypothetical protein